MPLPDGAVLNSYLDATDSVRVEQALRASNAALATADRLKSEFVANVSYQLSERWSVTGGGQFQTLGKHKEIVASRRVEIDFTKSIFVSLGLNYRY